MLFSYALSRCIILAWVAGHGNSGNHPFLDNRLIADLAGGQGGIEAMIRRAFSGQMVTTPCLIAK
jgi:hypothetical protein